MFSLCQEFVLATNLSTCPSARDKLKWAFKLYDKDESGLFFPKKTLLIVLRRCYWPGGTIRSCEDILQHGGCSQSELTIKEEMF